MLQDGSIVGSGSKGDRGKQLEENFLQINVEFSFTFRLGRSYDGMKAEILVEVGMYPQGELFFMLGGKDDHGECGVEVTINRCEVSCLGQ